MTNTPETVPAVWSTDDECFFRAVSDVFAPAFLQGAGVLLGSYDPEPARCASRALVTTDPARTEPAAAWPLAA